MNEQLKEFIELVKKNNEVMISIMQRQQELNQKFAQAIKALVDDLQSK